MRWFERTILYVYLTFLTGWMYLLHSQGLTHHEAIAFLFRFLAGVTRAHTT